MMFANGYIPKSKPGYRFVYCDVDKFFHTLYFRAFGDFKQKVNLDISEAIGFCFAKKTSS